MTNDEKCAIVYTSMTHPILYHIKEKQASHARLDVLSGLLDLSLPRIEVVSEPSGFWAQLTKVQGHAPAQLLGLATQSSAGWRPSSYYKSILLNTIYKIVYTIYYIVLTLGRHSLIIPHFSSFVKSFFDYFTMQRNYCRNGAL